MDENNPKAANPPLATLRVLDCCLLGPSGLALQLADLGADVVKVEPPGGDYIRLTGWPMVEGVSMLHWHLNRGKRSAVIDLRSDEGVALFLHLVAKADVLIEGMRPGALAKRGLSWERLRTANPRLVFCAISGFGATGPLAQMATHGFGFDSWAGVAPPRIDARGFHAIPENHIPIGYTAGTLYGAIGVLACVIRARASGEGARLEVSQAAAAASFNWMALEAARINDRAIAAGATPDSRPAGGAGLQESVRYQYYPTSDGCILFMPTEQRFWRNFCAAIDRMDIFNAHPGPQYADHARGNVELRHLLTDLFAMRSTADWVQLGLAADVPIAPVHDARSLLADAHFHASMDWLPAEQCGIDMLTIPLRLPDEALPVPRKAPGLGEHTDEVVRDWLGGVG